MEASLRLWVVGTCQESEFCCLVLGWARERICNPVLRLEKGASVMVGEIRDIDPIYSFVTIQYHFM